MTRVKSLLQATVPRSGFTMTKQQLLKRIEQAAKEGQTQLDLRAV